MIHCYDLGGMQGNTTTRVVWNMYIYATYIYKCIYSYIYTLYRPMLINEFTKKTKKKKCKMERKLSLLTYNKC